MSRLSILGVRWPHTVTKRQAVCNAVRLDGACEARPPPPGEEPTVAMQPAEQQGSGRVRPVGSSRGGSMPRHARWNAPQSWVFEKYQSVVS